MCFETDDEVEVNGNVAAEVPEKASADDTPTYTTYPVPARKFTLPGKTLAAVLAERFPNQDAREIECRTNETHVWIGATKDRYSINGSYFNVTTKKLNQHTNEYTFRPGV